MGRKVLLRPGGEMYLVIRSLRPLREVICDAWGHITFADLCISTTECNATRYQSKSGV